MNHFQPFWFPKVSIFKPKIFAKLRISQKILHQLTRATPTLPSMENQEASSRTEFVSRSLSEPKIFPKSSQRSFPGGWRMLVVDRWLHFPKSHQENHQLFGSQWTVEPYWNSYGFQLVIFTLFWQIDILKKIIIIHQPKGSLFILKREILDYLCRNAICYSLQVLLVDLSGCLFGRSSWKARDPYV